MENQQETKVYYNAIAMRQAYILYKQVGSSETIRKAPFLTITKRMKI